MTDGTLDNPDQVGRFRKEGEPIHLVDVRDEEIMHVPPPAKELPDAASKALFTRFANRTALWQENLFTPFIAGCVLHFQLGFGSSSLWR